MLLSSLLLFVCSLSVIFIDVSSTTSTTSLITDLRKGLDPHVIRANCDRLNREGRMSDLVEYLLEVERLNGGTLKVDDERPSLYTFLGVGYYNLQDREHAEQAFQSAIKHYPNETRAYINLGEVQVQGFKLSESIASFIKAYDLGDLSSLPRIIRAKGWAADWQDFDFYTADLEKFARICVRDPHLCQLDSSGGYEYTDATPKETLLMNVNSPYAAVVSNPLQPWERASLWSINDLKKSSISSISSANPTGSKSPQRRIKIGFASSDFGVHPVANLIRGLLQFLDRSRFEVFCFALSPEISWWGGNISQSVEHFIYLPSGNFRQGAELIASRKVEILIELNGHTLNSGLNLLSYRPAPLQMSFLGLPTTTGAEFVQYYIGDYVALPVEKRDHFKEHLLLNYPCYIVNDYAQISGHLVKMPQASRREAVNKDMILKASLLLGTLSNSQKMDPMMFDVWMNVMRRFAGSQMVIMRYAGATYYEKNIQRTASFAGIQSNRIHLIEQAPYIDHLFIKTAFDLLLDTRTKNGHTTGLDAIWAGVPTLTFAGGRDMPSRAGESIYEALGSHIGLAFSLKEYEDIAFSVLRKKPLSEKLKAKIEQMKELLVKREQNDREHFLKDDNGDMIMPDVKKLFNADAATNEVDEQLMHDLQAYNTIKYPLHENLTHALFELNPESYNKYQLGDMTLLDAWRKKLGGLRLTSPLFDTKTWTKDFESMMEATWEAFHLSHQLSVEPFHIFAQVSKFEKRVKTPSPAPQLGQVYTKLSRFFAKEGENSDSAEININVETGMRRVQQLDDDVYEDEDNTDAEANMSGNHKLKSKPSEQRPAVLSQGYQQHNDNGDAAQTTVKKKYKPLPKEIFDGRLIFLNMGGTRKTSDWLMVNAQRDYRFGSDTHTDIFRNVDDLFGFPNNSVSALYSSHTLEHVPHKHLVPTMTGKVMLCEALYPICTSFVGVIYRIEWYRVIRPGGIVLVSVPNFEVLAKLFLDKSLSFKDRWFLTNVAYGSQSDEYDFHFIGFYEELLKHVMEAAGFCSIERVSSLNIGFTNGKEVFSDSSDLTFKGHLLSLNMVAKVCPIDKPGIAFDKFNINHNAFPYYGDRVDDYPEEMRRNFINTEGLYYG